VDEILYTDGVGTQMGRFPGNFGRPRSIGQNGPKKNFFVRETTPQKYNFSVTPVLSSYLASDALNWAYQLIMFEWKADITGTGSRSFNLIRVIQIVRVFIEVLSFY